MSWRGGAANPPCTPADTSRTAVPSIPGYITWSDGCVLHARYQETPAAAHRDGRRWHVIAFSPQGLAEAVR
jgi:hypothetical protein